MKITLKIQGTLLDEVRTDLERPHRFAHERVGFFLTALTSSASGLLLIASEYRSVLDDEYEVNHNVGAQIGSTAIRNAIQVAYQRKRGLLHVHTHGGRGRPGFSSTDTRSASEFIPGFFNPVPRYPHGLLVLSDNDAAGMVWLSANSQPQSISNFIRVGKHYNRSWGES